MHMQMCRHIGSLVVWLLGICSIIVMGSLASKRFIYRWFPSDADVTWWSTGVTIAAGPFVLLCASAIQRNTKLQIFTWAPLPISLIVALWILEDTSLEDLEAALQAAFSASFISVAFDLSLRTCIRSDLGSCLLWSVVCTCTVVAVCISYAAASDLTSALSLGIIAAALNILNIPHHTPKSSGSSKANAARPYVVIPFVWTLLTTSVVLQQCGFLREAGILSNAPCLHFVVAFMLWWTSTHEGGNLTLEESVLRLNTNIGLGAVAVFSSSVFTVICWQNLRRRNPWVGWGAGIGAAFLVAIIMYADIWLYNDKHSRRDREFKAQPGIQGAIGNSRRNRFQST